MWQPLGRNQFYFDLAPTTISGLVAWTVTEHILVAQLYSNFCSHIRQLIGITDGKSPASSHFRDLSQQRWTIDLFGLDRINRIKTDGVNLNIRFLDPGLDFILR